jgi:outer membrane protein OmpA-like peptidoglycan-associated protein
MGSTGKITQQSPTQAISAAVDNKVMPAQEPFKQDSYKEVLQGLSIQRKLSIGAVDDPLENEANAMADKVMRMPEQPFVQRKCAACGEEEIQRKPASSITPFIQRSLEVSNDPANNLPAADVATTMTHAAKITHFNTVIQSLCSTFRVNAAGMVEATTSPAPTAAVLAAGSHPLGCCGLSILVNGVNPWKIKPSQLLGPHTNESLHEVVLPTPGSDIAFGNFTAGGTRSMINDVVVAGHELIGHAAQKERNIHNQGGEDRESFNHHDPTVRVQNILAHEQGIASSADRGLAASSSNRGESFGKIEVSQFASNSSDVTALPAPERAKLALAAAFIIQNKMWVDIVGHSDPVGSSAAKQATSDRRAEAVKNELIRLGVTTLLTKSFPTYTYTARRRFTNVIGVSDTQPPAAAAGNADWRRVEIFAAGHPAGAVVPPADLPALGAATPGADVATEKASADPCHSLLANSAFP